MIDQHCGAIDGSGRTIAQGLVEELARNPGAQLGAGGSRVMDGNYDYIETVKQEIADYHGVEAALIVAQAVTAIPQFSKRFPGQAMPSFTTSLSTPVLWAAWRAHWLVRRSLSLTMMWMHSA